MSLADIKTRIEVIEETYEFMLAYAAQGIERDTESKAGGQLRDFLKKAEEAVGAIASEFRALVESENLEPKAELLAYIEVIEADARASGAGLKLILAQDAISSQLVDNMNANIHLRALLTDLFLIDEIVKKAVTRESKI